MGMSDEMKPRYYSDSINCFQCDKPGEKIKEMYDAGGFIIETSYTKCTNGCEVTYLTPMDEARYNTNLIKAMKAKNDTLAKELAEAKEKIERLTARGIEDMQHEIKSLKAEKVEK